MYNLSFEEIILFMMIWYGYVFFEVGFDILLPSVYGIILNKWFV